MARRQDLEYWIRRETGHSAAYLATKTDDEILALYRSICPVTAQ